MAQDDLAEELGTHSNLEESIVAISQRCSVLPDLDIRSANEILGYDAIGAFPSQPEAVTR